MDINVLLEGIRMAWRSNVWNLAMKLKEGNCYVFKLHNVT